VEGVKDLHSPFSIFNFPFAFVISRREKQMENGKWKMENVSGSGGP
jgi:hypothetical protein